MEKLIELDNELEELERVEEKFFQQKSRAQFVKEGDRNSAYFFKKVTMRWKMNMVQCLYNRQGQKLETYETIAAELIAFYSGSLGENDENVVSFPDSLVKEILGCMLSDENVVSSECIGCSYF
ncbi:hypothetical protein V6N11_033536 [Hibiscus sabdariffa]|uniref:Uncharacterized protein n=1 Tax=Hibiscus sabdariffa TaxID=183260 RepID=A0ABR2PYB9_9ROSI